MNDLSLTTELAKYGILVLGLGLACLALWKRNQALFELLIEREEFHSNRAVQLVNENSEKLAKQEQEFSKLLQRMQENHMLQQHSTATQVMRSFFSASLATPKDLVKSSIESSEKGG